jgi:DNA-directed RNA polymerase subunit RPC12/RpoP
MMNALKYFPVTSYSPSQKEKDLIEKIKEKPLCFNTNLIESIVTSLINKGLVDYFQHEKSVYIFPLGGFYKTFMFKFPKFPIEIDKVTPIAEPEQQKTAYLRRFIANWICHTDKIDNNTFAFYLGAYQFFMQCIISIPDFMETAFFEDMGKFFDIGKFNTDKNSYAKELNPEIRKLKCNVCGSIVKTLSKRHSVVCPNCKYNILNKEGIS